MRADRVSLLFNFVFLLIVCKIGELHLSREYPVLHPPMKTVKPGLPVCREISAEAFFNHVVKRPNIHLFVLWITEKLFLSSRCSGHRAPNDPTRE